MSTLSQIWKKAMQRIPASMEKKGQRIVIFVDIPDPDNILMIIYLLRHYQTHNHDGKIAIVLSPRAIDFSIPSYGAQFPVLRKAFPGDFKALIMPIRNEDLLKERMKTVPEEFKPWFYVDEGCNNKNVLDDTLLYMEVSILRTIHTLDRQRFSRNDYEVYWDQSSLDCSEDHEMKKLGNPAMRHAFHSHDFTYDFDDRELEQYRKIIRGYQGAPSPELRSKLRALCIRYRNRMRRQLGKPASGKEDNGKFEDLVLSRQTHNIHRDGPLPNIRLIIGGPFTEALRYLSGVGIQPPDGVLDKAYRLEATIMAGSRDTSKNIFPNQFNIYADVAAAASVFKMWDDWKIPTMIVPTECVKSSEYQFTLEEAEQMLNKSEHLKTLVKRFDADTGKSGIWCGFDVIAAVAHVQKDIYTWEPVRGDYSDVEGPASNKPYEFKPAPGSTLLMAIPDKEYMAKNRDELEGKIASCVVEDVD
jgi:hypothetical protein